MKLLLRTSQIISEETASLENNSCCYSGFNSSGSNRRTKDSGSKPHQNQVKIQIYSQAKKRIKTSSRIRSWTRYRTISICYWNQFPNQILNQVLSQAHNHFHSKQVVVSASKPGLEQDPKPGSEPGPEQVSK